MTIINSYKNGNTSVDIYYNGTKIREYSGVPKPLFPETIDVKITNKCDIGCKYCHEKSNLKGEHADLNVLLDTIKDLNPGVELAIGGGNPLSHPQLKCFLKECKSKGFICNLTINQLSINSNRNLISDLYEEDLIKAMGISVANEDNIKELKIISSEYNNVVFHVIAGINNHILIKNIQTEVPNSKVLVLGYKKFGLGESYYNEKVEYNIKQWYMHIRDYMGKSTISFDNLSIEQLNIKRFMTDEKWNEFYMGDDFSFSMYIDAINKEFAPTSRSNFRKSFSEYTLVDFFQEFKNG